MTTDNITKDQITSAIRGLGILLDEVIEDRLKTKYYEKYQNKKFDFDNITLFDCMHDDINRIMEIAILHDWLVDISKDDFLYIITGDVEDINLIHLSEEELIMLLQRINNELKKDRGY